MEISTSEVFQQIVVPKRTVKSSMYPKKLSVCLEFDTTKIATYRKAEFCDFSFVQLIHQFFDT